jgi:hypothetical protein
VIGSPTIPVISILRTRTAGNSATPATLTVRGQA